METDAVVMAELGGPVPREEIPAPHRRRLDGVATGWMLCEEDGGYRDAKLRVNHWVLTLRVPSPDDG